MSLTPRQADGPDYVNPILDADWPDPDVIRIGDRYVLVASSFNRSPGLPVLVSADLVHWSIASHALDRIHPVEHFELPRHGQGVWAPSIRFHDGLLRIYYPDPDRGIFVVTAPGPEGPWTEPVAVLEGLGLIDPCPLFDGEHVYLVHGWAASRSGRSNELTVVELDASGTRPIGIPRTVVDGDEVPGCTTLEGPKFYRRGDDYWIFAPAGGVATGWQLAFRSTSPWGPYESRIVLEQGESAVNGPHQGGWVTANDGSDWFAHFQDTGVFGRVVHLQPMEWRDGWPVMGDPREGLPGQPVAEMRWSSSRATKEPAYLDHPRFVPPAPGVPSRSDDFASTSLAPQWHWQANPRPDQMTLRGDGTLVLPLRSNDSGNIRTLPQVLSQQLPSSPTTVTTTLRLDSTVDGARAGLTVLGTEYAWIGLVVSGGAVRVGGGRGPGHRGDRAFVESAPVASDVPVELRLRSRGDARVDFAWRQGEGDWNEAIVPFRAKQGTWIGAEIGLFSAAPYGSENTGAATFGPVSVVPATTQEKPHPRVREPAESAESPALEHSPEGNPS
jgi:beta-xylosidase